MQHFKITTHVFTTVGFFWWSGWFLLSSIAQAANEQVSIEWQFLPANEIAWDGTNPASTSAHATANVSSEILNSSTEALEGGVEITYEWQGATAQNDDPSWATSAYHGASASMNDQTIRVRARGVFSYVGVGQDGNFGTADDTHHAVTSYSDYLERTLTVFGIDTIKAKSAVGNGAYGATAIIAAGPYATDIHRADIEFKLKPGAASQNFSFPVEITNAHGAQSNNQKASVWYAEGGGAIINNVDDAGHGSGSVSLNEVVYAKMAPGNLAPRTATLSSAAGGSVGVTFKWANSPQWNFPEYIEV
jgi:hypothetical protein